MDILDMDHEVPLLPDDQMPQDQDLVVEVTNPPEQEGEHHEPIGNSGLKYHQGFNTKMFWFRWDTTEVWNFNFPTQTWTLVNGVNPPQKFLFFSSVVHLPES